MAIKITHLDNSGFLVEFPDVFLVFDYYIDPAHNVKKALEHHPDKPVIFFVTHIHEDHYNKDIFNLGQSHKRIYVLPDELPSRDVRDDIPADWMHPGDDVTIGDIDVKAFGSTDRGVSYLVTMPDGFTVFHAGDLNNWHWKEESTPREVHKAAEAFTVIVDRIAAVAPRIDVVFFPVDVRLGSCCAEGAEQFLKTINTGNFIPMHFKGDYDMACAFQNYKIPEEVRQRTAMYCLHKPGQSIEIK